MEQAIVFQGEAQLAIASDSAACSSSTTARPRGRIELSHTTGKRVARSLGRSFGGNRYGRLRTALSGLEQKHREVMRLEVEDSWLSKQYDKFSQFNYDNLQKSARTAADNGGKWDGVTCSLVEQVVIEDIKIDKKDGDRIVIPPPAHCFGHVIHVPDFGTIFLAELKVNHNSFHLTMIRLELGCIADGSASIVSCNVNGGRKPPPPPGL